MTTIIQGRAAEREGVETAADENTAEERCGGGGGSRLLSGELKSVLPIYKVISISLAELLLLLLLCWGFSVQSVCVAHITNGL